jgi:selenocysteine lyase/cysteine desulfurase
VLDSFHFDNENFRLKPHAGRWESGTLNVGGVVALGASADLLLGLGIPTVTERILELTDHLCEAARRAGLTVFSSRRPEERSGIVSLLPPAGAEPRRLVRRCREAGVVINHRAARLRLSPHCYNTTEELDRAVELLRPTSP